MAALHEALKCLLATSWDSVPTAPDETRTYINNISTQARLIVDSVPEPPILSEGYQKHYQINGTRPCTQIMSPSAARRNTTDPATLALQREWGKPIKISSAKDNPLDIPVYKLPGVDGHGHWFARRSVHEGLPFSVWQEKLSGEIATTLRENQARTKDGKPADMSVRGIGAEKQVEDIEVFEKKISSRNPKVIGKVSVFHVSAQFPGPTTSRDFVTMIISWETQTETEIGAEKENNRAECGGGRNWMMVSRPCQHPDVPPTQGYIRGEYESVEFIREIPVKPKGEHGGIDGEEGKWNPVEWIMVTRSDPGGNIPRWMVEKGTPRSICSDAVKFLDWACQDIAASSSNKHHRKTSDRSESSHPTTAIGDRSGEDSSDTDITEPERVEHYGLIASVAYLINAGLERYAPQAVLDYIPHHLRPAPSKLSSWGEQQSGVNGLLIDSHKTSSNAPDGTALAQSPVAGVEKDSETRSQTSTNSCFNDAGEINLDISPAEMIRRNKTGKLSSHDKQLAKLAQQKRSIEAQLNLIRTDIESLRLRPTEEEARRAKATALASLESPSHEQTTSSAASSIDGRPNSVRRSSSNSGDPRNRNRPRTPTRETARLHKVASSLFHEESKLLRQLGKIEKQQVKEASKIEAHQRKKAEKNEKKGKSNARAEAENLRREIDDLRKECEKLKNERQKWLDTIESLHNENKMLTRAHSPVQHTR